MTEQQKMRDEQLRKQTRERHGSVRAREEMREIEISEIKVRNLLTHEWTSYLTTEDLQDKEIVFVNGIGECEVRKITKGLVELWMVKGKGEDDSREGKNEY